MLWRASAVQPGLILTSLAGNFSGPTRCDALHPRPASSFACLDKRLLMMSSGIQPVLKQIYCHQEWVLQAASGASYSASQYRIRFMSMGRLIMKKMIRDMSKAFRELMPAFSQLWHSNSGMHKQNDPHKIMMDVSSCILCILIQDKLILLDNSQRPEVKMHDNEHYRHQELEVLQSSCGLFHLGISDLQKLQLCVQARMLPCISSKETS